MTIKYLVPAFTATNVMPTEAAPPGLHYYVHSDDTDYKSKLELALSWISKDPSGAWWGFNTVNALSFSGILYRNGCLTEQQRLTLSTLGYNYIGMRVAVGAGIWDSQVVNSRMTINELVRIMSMLVALQSASNTCNSKFERTYDIESDIAWQCLCTRVHQIYCDFVLERNASAMKVEFLAQHDTLRIRKFSEIYREQLDVFIPRANLPAIYTYDTEVIDSLRTLYPDYFGTEQFPKIGLINIPDDPAFDRVPSRHLVPINASN